MSFLPVVNINEKTMTREEVMVLLMETYETLERSQGPDYCEITLRLHTWAGQMPTSNDEGGEG